MQDTINSFNTQTYKNGEVQEEWNKTIFVII